MTVYLISDVRPRDAVAFAAYRKRAAISIAAYGGRYLVRGGRCQVLEGEPREHQLIIVSFPSGEQARRWYASPEYAAALAYRDQALERDLILVDGVGESD